MKNVSSTWRFVIAALIAAAAVVPIVVASRDAGADATPRDIRLVVRDMTFYLEGQEAPNPLLHVRAGEQIRIVLRNEDAGMDHDLVIKSWNIATPTLGKKGEEASVTFRVPARPGIETYTCTPHAEMMRGAIHVE